MFVISAPKSLCKACFPPISVCPDESTWREKVNLWIYWVELKYDVVKRSEHSETNFYGKNVIQTLHWSDDTWSDKHVKV